MFRSSILSRRMLGLFAAPTSRLLQMGGNVGVGGPFFTGGGGGGGGGKKKDDGTDSPSTAGWSRGGPVDDTPEHLGELTSAVLSEQQVSSATSSKSNRFSVADDFALPHAESPHGSTTNPRIVVVSMGKDGRITASTFSPLSEASMSSSSTEVTTSAAITTSGSDVSTTQRSAAPPVTMDYYDFIRHNSIGMPTPMLLHVSEKVKVFEKKQSDFYDRKLGKERRPTFGEMKAKGIA